jgi:short-subunit dehydrogenase
MRLSHAALRGQAERGRGGVINVSSVAAFLPRGTYAAAKAWVNQFGKWSAAEYRPRGVTVTTVCPGFTKTEFHQRMGVRRGTGFLWMEPDFVVGRALADFDRGRVISVPGAQYRAIVTATRLVPSRALQAYQSIGRR